MLLFLPPSFPSTRHMITIHFSNITEKLNNFKLKLYYFYTLSIFFIPVIFLSSVFILCARRPGLTIMVVLSQQQVCNELVLETEVMPKPNLCLKIYLHDLQNCAEKVLCWQCPKHTHFLLYWTAPILVPVLSAECARVVWMYAFQFLIQFYFNKITCYFLSSK